MAIRCWGYVGHSHIKHMILDSLHWKCAAACTTGTNPAAPEEQSSESLASLSEIGISPSARLWEGRGGIREGAGSMLSEEVHPLINT